MVLHFFRERIKERIDFSDVIDVFFGELENCEITSDDDQVDIQITEPTFDFKYHFYITKRTRVTNIIKLNPSFVNTNILIEIPVLLPKFLVRKILKIVGDLCKRFELSVYHDMISDIHIYKKQYVVRCGYSQCFNFSIEEIKKIFDAIGTSL